MTVDAPLCRGTLKRGMTLVELSIAIVVLLLFLGMLFVGARAWKRGSDRAACVMNIYQTQLAVRSFANMYGLLGGTDTSKLPSPIDMRECMMGEHGYLGSEPECPAQGTYTFGGNVIPATGDLYMSCSLAEARAHFPENADSW